MGVGSSGVSICAMTNPSDGERMWKWDWIISSSSNALGRLVGSMIATRSYLVGKSALIDGAASE